MHPDRALLLSGGIGDYLHYLVRIPEYLKLTGLHPQDLTVFVESTNPRHVRNIFEAAFPEVSLRFTPAPLHWTKTNPLLNPVSASERMHRPAMDYVRAQGFRRIDDWFLPFLCVDLGVDPEPLRRIVRSRPTPERPYVVIALRDKGFLWWPEEALCRSIERLVGPAHETFYVGTGDERPSWLSTITCFEDSLDALCLSHGATLLVGTDTGLATIRELSGLSNVYCVSEYWLRELMIRFRYVRPQDVDKGKSVFAFSPDEVLDGVHKALRLQSENASRSERASNVATTPSRAQQSLTFDPTLSYI